MRVSRLRLPFDVTLAMPGSKSHANRAIVLACLAEGRTTIRRATASDDVALLVDSLARMGFRIGWRERRDGVLDVDGGIPVAPPGDAPVILDCGLAGTTLRFLTALAALVPGEWVLTGSPRMLERPIGPLVDALRALGADVEAKGGVPPVRVRGGLRRGGEVAVDASRSSQFVTALMLVAPRLAGGLRITWGDALASGPYVDMTENVLATFGADVQRDARSATVRESRMTSPGELEIEGDWSAAGAWFTLAALTRSRFTAPNLDPRSPQGDRSVPIRLAELARRGDVELDVAAIPDQLMNIAAFAAIRDGRTTIVGAANTRTKESDRIAATVAGLRALGATAHEIEDGLVVEGAARLSGAELSTHGDHRLAMAFAVLGSLVEGVELDDVACVSKSYPAFFDDLLAAHAPTAARCLAIVGMRGAGKSTLAAALASRLELQLADSDALFESAHGPIRTFVERDGWAAFREIESGIVADCLAPGRVVAIGGGALESTATFDLLRHRALVVWVREEPETLVERLRDGDRPPLTDAPLEREVRDVLAQRTPAWEACADLALPPGATVDERVAAVETWLREPFTRHDGG